MGTRTWFPTLVYNAPLVKASDAKWDRELLAECLQIRDADDAERPEFLSTFSHERRPRRGAMSTWITSTGIQIPKCSTAAM